MFIKTKKMKLMMSALVVGTVFSAGATCFASDTPTITPLTTSVATPTVTPAPITVSPTTTGYTGLIVDCRGLDLKPAMSPVIRVDGAEPIYGSKNLDYDRVISKGMASYTVLADGTSVMPSTGRAGAHPLIVKALRLENFNTYPVLTPADAKIVTDANSSDKFLENLAVVFVK